MTVTPNYNGDIPESDLLCLRRPFVERQNVSRAGCLRFRSEIRVPRALLLEIFYPMKAKGAPGFQSNDKYNLSSLFPGNSNVWTGLSLRATEVQLRRRGMELAKHLYLLEC
jgi:hypothetical protein